MAKAKEFAKNMSRRGKSVQANAEKTKRKAALLVLRNLVLSTPVDTGRARSNWLVEVQKVSRDTVDPTSPQVTLANGDTKVRSSSPGKFIAVSNNLPYIGPLNRGTSAQAPAMFVESAVMLAVSNIKNTRLLIK